MKTIYLLRHADAKSGRDYANDHARELTADGHAQARRVGRFLQETGQIPDRLVSSSAVRAVQTAEGLPESWPEDVPLRTTRDLYEAQTGDVLDAVHTTGESARSVLLVGHQPTWSAAVSRLVGGANLAFPTATCARIDAQAAAWSEVHFGRAQLTWLLPAGLI